MRRAFGPYPLSLESRAEIDPPRKPRFRGSNADRHRKRDTTGHSAQQKQLHFPPPRGMVNNHIHTRETTAGITWTAMRAWVRRFSRIGPKRNNNTFKSVRFVASRIVPSGSVVSSVQPSTASTRRTTVESRDGRFRNWIWDGCKECVSRSKLQHVSTRHRTA